MEMDIETHKFFLESTSQLIAVAASLMSLEVAFTARPEGRAIRYGLIVSSTLFMLSLCFGVLSLDTLAQHMGAHAECARARQCEANHASPTEKRFACDNAPSDVCETLPRWNDPGLLMLLRVNRGAFTLALLVVLGLGLKLALRRDPPPAVE